jgi:hypothetical protein
MKKTKDKKILKEITKLDKKELMNHKNTLIEKAMSMKSLIAIIEPYLEKDWELQND